ncbi:hypothetical protein PIB30_041552 [Stylosanthes scabra]|uniref:Uncharacterized protein n=1 Tax=Stylosanthes scabra TaxID=79078 RepID=A0ABU6ZDQ0_9FABA|nr:hypothetical protein [Stylosanthes scabra]
MTLCGCAGSVGDSQWKLPQCQCSAERFLGMACQSLGVGFPLFVPQQIQPAKGKELFGYTVILPKSERGLEVVAYGPVAADEGIARTEAAEMMMRRVLAATNKKMRALEAKNAEIKQLLVSAKLAYEMKKTSVPGVRRVWCSGHLVDEACVMLYSGCESGSVDPFCKGLRK